MFAYYFQSLTHISDSYPSTIPKLSSTIRYACIHALPTGFRGCGTAVDWKNKSWPSYRSRKCVCVCLSACVDTHVPAPAQADAVSRWRTSEDIYTRTRARTHTDKHTGSNNKCTSCVCRASYPFPSSAVWYVIQPRAGETLAPAPVCSKPDAPRTHAHIPYCHACLACSLRRCCCERSHRRRPTIEKSISVRGVRVLRFAFEVGDSNSRKSE